MIKTTMKQAITYSLPFDGKWLTFWGGDTLEQNIHHDTVSQKHAFDFIMVDESGKFFRTNGETVEDYYSFGQNILAPGDGKVAEAVDGLRDNKPGQLNSFNFLGNYIMIQHSSEAFSVLGHLQQGSVLVKAGQNVRAGEMLAKCGNSGYSTDPHLHYHVQDSAIFAEIDTDYKRIDIAKGKKIRFEQIEVINRSKNKTLKNYSPVKGDVVTRHNKPR